MPERKSIGSVNWQAVSAAVAALALLTAIAGACIAFGQYRNASILQREATAQQTYDQYLRLSFEHPDLAAAEVGDSTLAREKYGWFVSIMLNAGERILLQVPDDKEWGRAVRSQVAYHCMYLKGSEFQSKLACHYSPQIREIVQKICGTPKHQCPNGE
ncbi:MAG TPA: hypothetical protein VN524_01210 [Hyphomicrobiaceae bacterium]|nr:hypothetical protein [Hyphomicrobiaceae bacterium]